MNYKKVGREKYDFSFCPISCQFPAVAINLPICEYLLCAK